MIIIAKVAGGDLLLPASGVILGAKITWHPKLSGSLGVDVLCLRGEK